MQVRDSRTGEETETIPNGTTTLVTSVGDDDHDNSGSGSRDDRDRDDLDDDRAMSMRTASMRSTGSNQ